MVKSVRRDLLVLVGAVLLIITASGCGNSLSCALSGDNLKGHISFAANYPVDTSTVVVEWSKTSFATTANGHNSYKNSPGLVNIAYSMCVDNDVNIQVRAYQDTSGDGTLTAGESSGRYDQTANGNATFVNVNIASDNTKWNSKNDADITIDSATP